MRVVRYLCDACGAVVDLSVTAGAEEPVGFIWRLGHGLEICEACAEVGRAAVLSHAQLQRRLGETAVSCPD